MPNQNNGDVPSVKSYIRVPQSMLGIFLVMIAQTFGAGWWASSMSTKVDFVQTQLSTVVSANANNYTQKEAVRDLGDISKRLDKLEDLTNEYTRTIKKNFR
jgi:hypothetical protein